MKLKKILTATATIIAGTLLLTACSTGATNGGDTNGADGGEKKEYLTLSQFSTTDDSLTEAENASAFYSRFNNEESTGIETQMAAAAVASYLDHTAYSYYFISDWWGEKDKFENKGFDNFKNYITPSLLEEIQGLNKDKNKDPLGAKYFFHQPKAISDQGYKASPECFASWEPTACMYPYKTETLNFVSINAHRAVVDVTTEYRVYVADETGDTKDQTVSYTSQLQLVQNDKLQDITSQPFYLVDKVVSGGYTYAEPVSMQ